MYQITFDKNGTCTVWHNGKEIGKFAGVHPQKNYQRAKLFVDSVNVNLVEGL